MQTLNKHEYAPELNTVSIRGVTIFNHIGCKTLAEWRKKNKPRKKGLYIWIDKIYNAPFENLARKSYYCGYGSISDVVSVLKKLRSTEVGGKLLSGDTLPPPEFNVRIKVIG